MKEKRQEKKRAAFGRTLGAPEVVGSPDVKWPTVWE